MTLRRDLAVFASKWTSRGRPASRILDERAHHQEAPKLVAAAFRSLTDSYKPKAGEMYGAPQLQLTAVCGVARRAAMLRS